MGIFHSVKVSFSSRTIITLGTSVMKMDYVPLLYVYEQTWHSKSVCCTCCDRINVFKYIFKVTVNVHWCLIKVQRVKALYCLFCFSLMLLSSRNMHLCPRKVTVTGVSEIPYCIQVNLTKTKSDLQIINVYNWQMETMLWCYRFSCIWDFIPPRFVEKRLSPFYNYHTA